MALKTTVKAMVEAANREIETIPVEQARAMLGDENVVFVDIRDVRELEREGMIPGAFHAPRGMLEFWIDPESPYHKPIFAEAKRFLFYCASGWRSALAARTAVERGLPGVSHLDGGFTAWKEAGAPVAQKPPHAAPSARKPG